MDDDWGKLLTRRQCVEMQQNSLSLSLKRMAKREYEIDIWIILPTYWLDARTNTQLVFDDSVVVGFGLLGQECRHVQWPFSNAQWPAVPKVLQDLRPKTNFFRKHATSRNLSDCALEVCACKVGKNLLCWSLIRFAECRKPPVSWSESHSSTNNATFIHFTSFQCFKPLQSWWWVDGLERTSFTHFKLTNFRVPNNPETGKPSQSDTQPLVVPGICLHLTVTVNCDQNREYIRKVFFQ